MAVMTMPNRSLSLFELEDNPEPRVEFVVNIPFCNQIELVAVAQNPVRQSILRPDGLVALAADAPTGDQIETVQQRFFGIAAASFLSFSR